MVDTTSLIGKTFGRLTVIERDLSKPIGHGYDSFWICECECGNIKSIRRSNLTRGKSLSCGCLRSELVTKKNTKDITGQHFGDLTALHNTYFLSPHRSYLWECECQCGNHIFVPLEVLTQNDKLNCGCKNVRSKGELEYKKYLDSHNIEYKEQYKFDDCRDKMPLPFDFAIFENGQLVRLVEIDGEQHRGYGLYANDLVSSHDKIKNDYCVSHNIELIRIPYENRKGLNLPYKEDN